MSIRAPYLPYDTLRAKAKSFQEKYNPNNEVPVPIERIVEFEFQIDIVPTPGLHDHFDIDSYPTSDLTEIHVDEYVYQNRPNRYRFSLAHELSHLIIHADLFRELAFETIDEWKTAVRSIPSDQYSWIEWQAYSLGGLLLVPPSDLTNAFQDVTEKAESAGISISSASDEAKKILASHIGTIFHVSAGVVERRIEADGLWKNVTLQPSEVDLG